MSKPVDLSGQTFGLLRVIEKATNVRHRNAFWTCACTCGSVIYVSGTNLRQGYTTSCGCGQEKRS
jgi:hypothetical protein